MENERLVSDQFWQQQLKYIYYMIALCVTSIGFSIVITKDDVLGLIHIPLGLAIVFWSVCICLGLNFLNSNIVFLSKNKIFLEGHRKLSSPDKLKELNEAFDKEFKKMNKNSGLNKKIQHFSFYAGFLCFFIGHIIKMYFN